MTVQPTVSARTQHTHTHTHTHADWQVSHVSHPKPISWNWMHWIVKSRVCFGNDPTRHNMRVPASMLYCITRNVGTPENNNYDNVITVTDVCVETKKKPEALACLAGIIINAAVRDDISRRRRLIVGFSGRASKKIIFSRKCFTLSPSIPARATLLFVCRSILPLVTLRFRKYSGRLLSRGIRIS